MTTSGFCSLSEHDDAMGTATEEMIKEKQLYRRILDTAGLVIRKDGEKRTLAFSASSETPVDRWYGQEILSHDKKAVRLDRASRGAMPLLFNHNIDDPVGMISTAKTEGGRLMVEATLFETARAKEVVAMIDGGLRNVSLAYRINVVEEDKKSETFTVTDWEPYEVSIVTVPADPTVGIGRGAETEYEVRMVRTSQPAAATSPTKEAGMEKEKDASAGATAVSEEPKKEDQRHDPVEYEKNRKRAIENLCRINKLDDKYKDHWIGSGLSIEEVSDDILRIMEERGKTNPQPASRLGLTSKETQQFSIMRAVKAICDKDWTHAPFELDCSRSVAQKLGKVVDPGRFFVPFEVMQRPVELPVERLERMLGRRDLTVGTAGAGGYLVATNNVGFIEILRNRSVVSRMGARRLPGLQGSVTVPRQSAAGTAYWLSTEATAITESQQTFVQMALSPKNVGAYTEISRQLLLQSSPGAEGIVTDDLAQVVAIAVDLAALNGSGASGQPTGVINTSGIGAVTGTSLGYAGVLEFQTDVAGSNVMPTAGGYVTTPAVSSLMMQRARFSNTDTPLWVGNIWDGAMAGFPAMSSNQVPSANMLFGDWQELVIGEWGVLEVEVNPYANFAAGIIGVRAIYSMDVGVRRPFAFSLATSIT